MTTRTGQFTFRPLLAALSAVVVTMLAGGCGPVTTSSLIGDASHDLDEAKSLGAEQNAPYEYTRAAAFLHKAKELEGFGLYQQASEYARQSRVACDKANGVARLAKDREKRDERFGSPKARGKSGRGDQPGAPPSSEGK